MDAINSISIRLKLTLFISFVLLTTTFIQSFLFFDRTVDGFSKELNKRGYALSSSLAAQCRYGLVIEDIEILSLLVQPLLEDPDVLYVRVKNAEGFEVVSVSRDENDINSVNTGSYEFRTPVVLDNVKENNNFVDELEGWNESDDVNSPLSNSISSEIMNIGEVYVGLSSEGIKNRTNDLLFFIFGITPIIILLAVVFSYFLSRFMIDPIIKIAKIASVVSETNMHQLRISSDQNSMRLVNQSGESEISISATRLDELGQLTSAFIRMSSQLQTYNSDLQHKVEERTSALTQALEQSRSLRETAELVSDRLQVANDRLTLYQRSLQETQDNVCLFDASGSISMVNRAFSVQNECNESECIGKSFSQIIAPSSNILYQEQVKSILDEGNDWNGELSFRKKNGVEYPVELSVAAVKNTQNQVIAYIAIFRDITQRYALQEELVGLAQKDPLTGLLNRRGFMQQLNEQLEFIREKKQQASLLWLDVDGFKDVNDSIGHLAGDELLCELSDRLRSLLPENSIIGRIGGDEFAVLVDATYNPDKISENILHNVSKSVFESLGEVKYRLTITVSIGVALFPQHGTAADELLTNADIAMYKSKDIGRNAYSIYDNNDVENRARYTKLEERESLRLAIENDQLVLYAQPIVEPRSGEVRQYELLLRMIDSDGCLSYPEKILSSAERYGYVQAIDRWVIKKSLQILSDENSLEANIPVAINLSTKALLDTNIREMLIDEIKHHEENSRRLIIEITEKLQINNVGLVKQFIEELQVTGLRFSLDDFGAGNSSFVHLKGLEVNFVKIDGEFIKKLQTSKADKKIVKSVIDLAHDLDKIVIAEHVENQETADILIDMGIDLVQGFHYGRPKPI